MHVFGAVLKPETLREPVHSLRTFSDGQRPVTANPLDMRPQYTAPKPMRATGVPPADLFATLSPAQLAHDVAADLQSMWPLTRHVPPPRKLRGAPGEAIEGRNGSRMKSLLSDSSVAPEPPPPPPRLTRNRADDYRLNKQRCAGTNKDLVAPPLYEVRPGTEPRSARPSAASGAPGRD